MSHKNYRKNENYINREAKCIVKHRIGLNITKMTKMKRCSLLTFLFVVLLLNCFISTSYSLKQFSRLFNYLFPKKEPKFLFDPISCGNIVHAPLRIWYNEAKTKNIETTFVNMYDLMQETTRKNVAYAKSLISQGADSFNIVVEHWNTEMLKPKYPLITYPLINLKSSRKYLHKINVYHSSMFFIFLQENKKYSKKEIDDFKNGILNFLNAEHDDTSDKNSEWVFLNYGTLNNNIGTKLRSLFSPNTQSWFGFVRKNLIDEKIITNVQSCGYSLKDSFNLFRKEKGFVGLSFNVKDVGKVAVIGVHLSKQTRHQEIILIMKKIPQECNPISFKSNLDDFDGGIIMVGDMNTRLSLNDLFQYYNERNEEKRSDEKLNFNKVVSWYEDHIKSGKYNDLPSWSLDEMGGAYLSKLDANLDQLPLKYSFIIFKFLTIGHCYNAPWTYKYLPTCDTKSSSSLSFLSNLVRFKSCFSKGESNMKKSKKFSQLPYGFLDRILIRDGIAEDYVNKLVQKYIYIEQGVLTPPLGTGADHAILTWKINFLTLKKHGKFDI